MKEMYVFVIGIHETVPSIDLAFVFFLADLFTAQKCIAVEPLLVIDSCIATIK